VSTTCTTKQTHSKSIEIERMHRLPKFPRIPRFPTFQAATSWPSLARRMRVTSRRKSLPCARPIAIVGRRRKVVCRIIVIFFDSINNVQKNPNNKQNQATDATPKQNQNKTQYAYVVGAAVAQSTALAERHEHRDQRRHRLDLRACACVSSIDRYIGQCRVECVLCALCVSEFTNTSRINIRTQRHDETVRRASAERRRRASRRCPRSTAPLYHHHHHHHRCCRCCRSANQGKEGERVGPTRDRVEETWCSCVRVRLGLFDVTSITCSAACCSISNYQNKKTKKTNKKTAASTQNNSRSIDNNITILGFRL
jgi:hypothetical protein